MKKTVAILAALLLLLLSSTAFAEKAGDTVTIPIYINTTNACYAKLTVSGAGWCDVLSVTSSYGQASGNQLNAQVNPVIPSGQVGSATVLITTNVAGTYRLNVSVSENWTYDEDFGDATAYSGSITVEANHTHSWGPGVVTTPPTCTEPGEATYTCTDETCGETTTKPVEAAGHSYDNGVETTQPTCEAEGVKTFSCQNCEEAYTESIPAKGHAEKTLEAVAATCTKPGKTAGKQCTVCGEITVEQTEVPAAGHKEETVKGTAATCTEPGKTDGKKCTVCGETTVEQTEIPAAGHNEVVDEAVAATCTEPGKTAGKHCDVCDEVIVAQETIPATGHTEETIPAVAADCKTKTNGKTAGVKCSVCGEILVAQETVLYQHTPAADSVVIDPTCTEDGSVTGSCSVCGDVLEQEILPATGHSWDAGTITTAPTCEAEGVKTYTCGNANCNETKTESVDATGHKWDDGVVTTAPTCEAEGVKTYTCANDSTHTKTEAVDATGHKWDAGTITTAPTCTETGVKTYICANEAAHTKTETVKALGHTWGEWEVTKPVVDDENGEKQRTCSVCGEVETRVIYANVYLHMNVCSMGIRFRDLENPVTDDWYMFTPIDLSVEGEQTFDLIAGNAHVIGTVTVTVAEGNVTVTYELFNDRNTIDVREFMTILPSIADVTEVDVEEMTGYAYGEPISIQDVLGGDTKVLLFICNKVIYEEDIKGIKAFDEDGEAYEAYVEELKLLMD